MLDQSAMKAPHPQALPPFPQLERRAPFPSGEASLRHFLRSTHEKGTLCECDLCKVLGQLFKFKEYGSGERAEVEEFIKKCFADAYGAALCTFMPRLFRLTTRRGEVVAAFGSRSAQSGPLFLETYLDEPVEQAIECKTGSRPQRGSIVEVGNLAAIYPGAVRWMIVALTVKLYEENYEWVAFTGTAALRNAFYKLGLRPVVIGEAAPERLDAGERARWGSYYGTRPLVMAGNIRHGLHAMSASAGLLRSAAEAWPGS
jgi:hypothetical protein